MHDPQTLKETLARYTLHMHTRTHHHIHTKLHSKMYTAFLPPRIQFQCPLYIYSTYMYSIYTAPSLPYMQSYLQVSRQNRWLPLIFGWFMFMSGRGFEFTFSWDGASNSLSVTRGGFFQQRTFFLYGGHIYSEECMHLTAGYQWAFTIPCKLKEWSEDYNCSHDIIITK